MNAISTIQAAGAAVDEGDQRRPDVEVLHLGSGRITFMDEFEEAAGSAGVLQLDLSTPSVADGPGARRLPAWSLRGWRLVAALALAFTTGLVASASALQPDDNPGDGVLPLTAGLARVNNNVPGASDQARLIVSVHASGAHDVEVVWLRPVGWPTGQAGGTAEPAYVYAGHWRDVVAHVALDCRGPEPPPLRAVEAHIRTDGDSHTVFLWLPHTAQGLTEAWRTACPASRTQPHSGNTW